MPLSPNQIIKGDCSETLKSFEPNSIHLTCTSPPYYNARDYSTWPDYESYLKFLEDTFTEVFRITKGKAYGGRSNSEYYRGGGILLLNSDMVSFEDCIFINNYALEGGGAYLGTSQEYKVSFDSCLFIGNESGDSHGGG